MSDISIKATVRDRDGHRCTVCGETAAAYFVRVGKRLDVHRLVPGSPYTMDGCETLCRRCHKRKHGGRKPHPGARVQAKIPAIVMQALRIRTLNQRLELGREVSRSEVVTEILRQALADELTELESGKAPSKPRRKPPAQP